MKKPIIGIPCPWSYETWGNRKEESYYYLGYPYVEAMMKHGAMPILLPLYYEEATLEKHIEEILMVVDGLLFSGGGDVKREVGAEIPSLREQQPHRYDFEMKLMKAAAEKGIPIMGICRGFQMMVEAFGGSLSEKLVEGHKQDIPGDQATHELEINPESQLYRLLQKETWKVNSFHVQKVESMPEGFIVSAKAGDVVEAMENTQDAFLVGYQFHPEELTEDASAAMLLGWFIESCTKY